MKENMKCFDSIIIMRKAQNLRLLLKDNNNDNDDDDKEFGDLIFLKSSCCFISHLSKHF